MPHLFLHLCLPLIIFKQHMVEVLTQTQLEVLGEPGLMQSMGSRTVLRGRTSPSGFKQKLGQRVCESAAPVVHSCIFFPTHIFLLLIKKKGKNGAMPKGDQDPPSAWRQKTSWSL